MCLVYGPVRAGELLAARRPRHVALACPELIQQVAGLIEHAERRGIPMALAVAQDEVRAKVGQVRERALPPLRSEVQQPRYAVRRSMWGSARPMPPSLYGMKSR